MQGNRAQLIAAVAFVLGLATPAPASTPAANEIYKRAMERLATLPQPTYIVDTENWVSVTGGDNGSSNWVERRVFDSKSRRECVLNVPFNPRAEPQIGESYFAPDTWLVRHPVPAVAGATNMAPDLSDLKVIANVVSVAKPSYDIRFVGIEALTHGGSAYHISLRPLSDPRKHNLRELWVNTSNDYIVRAIIEGDYRPTYSSIARDTFVMEDFGTVGPYWLVIHHVWTYGDPFSGQSIQYNATSLTMQFPAQLPDWLFDAKEFRLHENDVAGLIGP